ncbi:MAG: hypothetical protein K9N35_04480 [Candidatus Marinimicrobia bacterium]|nr:hypothetical protein [Candidatus Neomarinimicrobiota bacterium]
MRSRLILLLLVLLLQYCDQAPTTLDSEPFIERTESAVFNTELSSIEFDYLSGEFFFTALVTGPEAVHQVSLLLWSDSIQTDSIFLNDAGLEGDIIAEDGNYDGNWVLPDSVLLLPDSLFVEWVDQVWNVKVTVLDINMEEISHQQSYQPEVPAAPVIESIHHFDTLTLRSNALVLDTLRLEVSHPNGLDEIRDVSMMSEKPDGSFANDSTAIPLYDDGGREIFFTWNGIDFTSGDQVANDGVYSLLLALDPTTLTGTYYWTFNARSWVGLEAKSLKDSLVVLSAGGSTTAIGPPILGRGVLK